MVICRFRLLPRIPVSPSPSLHGHVIITQNFSSKATIPSRQCLAAPVPPLHPPSSAHASQRDLSPADGIRVSSDHLSRMPTQGTNQQSSTTSNQGKAEEKDDMGYSPTLPTLYARLNAPKFSKLPFELSSQQVRSVAFRVRRTGHPYVLDNLSRNILGSPDAKRAELAATLLSIPYLSLDPSLTASLSSCIPLDRLFFLPVHTLSRIACLLIDHPSPSNTETLLTRLVENITHRLELFRGNDHGPPSDVDTIPVWALFRLVIHLSEIHLREPATRVLQSLVEMAYIPPEAIQRIDQSSGDFHLIIVLTLVRSCISWNWNSRALHLLRGYLRREPSAGPIINRLCQDALYALMEFPTLEGLYLGVSFVERILSRPEPISVAPDIVRQIYSNALRLREPQIATRFYKFTQCKPTQSSRNHPLPSGSALRWFLRYLSNRADHLDIARRLVKQVVDRYEPIPLEDRAGFIAIAAERGFASSARSLWERYSSGSDGRTVAGNAAMVVRLCSLFANLRRGKAACKPESSEPEDSVIDGGPHDDANDICTSTLEDDEDFRNFANLVLTRFRETKEPLRHAPREDLNALARANVILGQNQEGLQILQIVLDRKERPDLHDANVVLSAIASVNPRTALKMVRRMVSRDPKPDGISFGTVIHEAARQGDFEVIIDALRLVQETGQQLTAKTMVSVIRASVAFSGADRDAVRDNLIHALRVIIANAHSNQIATWDMGQFCANEALKVDDPALAFMFWSRVVRPRTKWGDYSHGALRHRIASSIRSHCKKGEIGAAESKSMVWALRGEGKDGRSGAVRPNF